MLPPIALMKKQSIQQLLPNIMTEFIKLADKDDNIEKLMDLKLDIDQDTVTYLSLLKNLDKFEELKDINTNKIDEVILSTKGYFD